jgi:hypothetical protein
MSDKDDPLTATVEVLKHSVETTGAGVVTVSEGHILMFSRAKLQDMLDSTDSDTILIFLKRPINEELN